MSKEKYSKGKSMDDAPVSTRGNDRPRPSDLVDVMDIPEKWARMRFHGPVFTTGGHWVKTVTKDGKPTSFYTPCSAFDPEEGKRDSTKKCAWCGHKDQEEVRFSTDYWSNAIIRSLQKARPSTLSKPTKAELSEGFKDKDSETWTPNRAIRTTGNTMKMLKDLKPLNVVEDEEGNTVGYAISHVKHGCDVMLKQDKKAAPANRYQLQKSDQKPLTKEERAYLIYDLSELQEVPSAKEVQEEYDKWYERIHGKKKKGGDEDDEDETPRKKKRVVDDDDDEDDEPPRKKKRVVDDDDEDDELPKAKAKGKKKPVVDDDEDDEDLDDDDEDDEPPAKKKPAAKKKRVVDDDEDEDDEEEDEPPKKSKKKPVVDDDEDEDDEEDDEPPAKKGKKPVKKSRDDDFDEDDEDEDDEPPAKKKPAAKGKKKVVEDDEEDDEEDEDDEPPARSKKKVVAKKKRPADDEDDEDDDE